jgi:uncharacterized protein YegL
MALEPDDLVTNRQQRCPVVLALDASSSMHGTRIDTLNETLKGFKEELVSDPVAALRVELAVVRFDSTATLVQDFVTARNFNPPVLEASGTTAMGEAVNIALDQLEARKQRYRETGVKYYRPWLWLMSDGMPNDDWEAAAARALAAERDKKVSVFAVGIGDGANLSVLGEFSARPAVRVQPGMFGRMFEWLSASLQARSKSIPVETEGGDGAAAATTAAGEQIKFDPIDWGVQD